MGLVVLPPGCGWRGQGCRVLLEPRVTDMAVDRLCG